MLRQRMTEEVHLLGAESHLGMSWDPVTLRKEDNQKSCKKNFWIPKIQKEVPEIFAMLENIWG